MDVIKRNGEIVDFNEDKIEIAIGKALGETQEVIEWNRYEELLAAIYADIQALPKIQVEKIQDIVEIKLMKFGLHQTAKRYILYRQERNQARDKGDKDLISKYFSKDFLKKYYVAKEPFAPLGAFVKARTYARWLPEKGRRETWFETVKRAVEFNLSLAPYTKEEAQQLFDNVFYLRQNLSGRMMWLGGTKTAHSNALGLFNCAFTVLDSYETFGEAFTVLMLGAGLGIKITKEDMIQMLPLRQNISTIHKTYNVKPKSDRKEYTSIVEYSKDLVEINIGDSRGGWTTALDLYFKILYQSQYSQVSTIVFNYNNIRPKGERIKGFGGQSAGHMPIMEMFTRIHEITQQGGSRRYRLKTIDAFDIICSIALNVVSGNVRRSSIMTLCDSEDSDIVNAKNDLYIQEGGKWKINPKLVHRQMSNNTIIYQTKPRRDEFHDNFQKLRYAAEPATLNYEELLRRSPQAKGLNPCFRGDMRLLTVDGYKTFEELSGKDVQIVNKDCNISNGKVWCSGEKEIYEVKLANGESIFCTKDHRFLVDGDEVEAQHLTKKRLTPFLYSSNYTQHSDFIKLGFIQGDGMITKIDKEGTVEINLGKKDKEVVDFFGIKNFSGRKWRTHDFTEKIRQIGMTISTLPERNLPKEFNNFSNDEQLAFLKGLYSANGSVNGGKTKSFFISLKTTCKTLAEEVQTTLGNHNISSRIVPEKARTVKWDNGEFLSRESYSVVVSKFNDMVSFYGKIGFLHSDKMSKLKDLLLKYSPMVYSVKPTGNTEKVYDFSEPLLNWGVVEGYIAHNCGEILLDSNQCCNLTNNNVLAFVENGKLNKDKFYEACELSARAGYRTTCVELELPNWNYKQKRDRLLGVSLSGWFDMVDATNMSIEEQNEVLSTARRRTEQAAANYALTLGLNAPILTTTIKPSGTSSQLYGESAGIHRTHSPYFIRRVRISANDPLVKVCEELEYKVEPQVGEDPENPTTKVVEFYVKSQAKRTKGDVSAIEQLEDYVRFQQYWTNHNSSITVHVKDDEWEAVEEWMYQNWDKVLSVSFISYNDSFYQQLPYEDITEEQYKELSKNIQPFNQTLLTKYESKEMEEDLDSDCDSGVCAVR